MRITIKVHPRAKRNRLSSAAAGYKLEVTAPPIDGAANDAVIAFFAKGLRIPRSQVEIVSGEKSRQKIIEIPSLTDTSLKNLLSVLCVSVAIPLL